MATDILKALSNEGTHNVGTLNSIQAKTLAHGAKVLTEALDNWVLAELAGFDEDGEQLCKALSDKTKPAYLVATTEQRYMNEDIAHFYNDVGEMARLVVLESHYTRFEVSNFTLNEGVTEVEKGQIAHYDVATKKFILSKADAPHTDYATSAYQFVVVGDTADTAGDYLKPTVRLMCTKVGY